MITLLIPLSAIGPQLIRIYSKDEETDQAGGDDQELKSQPVLQEQPGQDRRSNQNRNSRGSMDKENNIEITDR